MVLCPGSLNSGKFSFFLALKPASAFSESALAPRITTPSSSKCFFASRNSDASIVQPEVLAFGKKKRSTRLPRKSESETSLPSSAFRVNSGALSPSFSIWIISSYLEHFISSRLDIRNLPKDPYLRKRHRLSASNHFRGFANNLRGFILLTQ